MSLVERYINQHERRLDEIEAALREFGQKRFGGAGGTFGGDGVVSIRAGKASGAITASTSTKPGSGTAQPVKLDGSGDYANDGGTVSVLNAGVAISSGKRVFIVTDAIGLKWATPEECES